MRVLVKGQGEIPRGVYPKLLRCAQNRSKRSERTRNDMSGNSFHTDSKAMP